MNPATCPACGSAMENKTGIYGEFLVCSKYPECTVIKEAGPGDSAVPVADDKADAAIKTRLAEEALQAPRYSGDTEEEDGDTVEIIVSGLIEEAKSEYNEGDDMEGPFDEENSAFEEADSADDDDLHDSSEYGNDEE